MHSTPTPSFTDRWEPTRCISEQPDRCVLLCTDRASPERRVVVKVVEAVERTTVDALRREYSRLRRVRHPNVAKATGFVTFAPTAHEGDERSATARPLAERLLSKSATVPFATLACIEFEHHEGRDLREAFELLFPRSRDDRDDRAAIRDADRRWQLFLKALADICSGLAAVHARGLVHFDIKPANIVLQPVESGSSGKTPPGFLAKIVDFGLCELETTPLGARARGTVPYIAPEVLAGGRIDRRCDLFSLGVTFAVAWSGHPPFPGDGPEDWVRAAREGRILPAKSPLALAPRGLDRLVERLLAPAPDDRPQGALDVARELARLGGFVLPASATPSIDGPPTIGQEGELETVRAELEQSLGPNGAPALIVVESDPDRFTGAFADEVETVARGLGARFTVTSCEPEPTTGWGPIARLLRHLTANGSSAAAADLELDDLAEAWLPAATATPRSPPSPTAYAQRVDRLSDLLIELARREPLTICLRDVHLIDEDSRRVLLSLARKLSVAGDRAPDALSEEPKPTPRLALVLFTDPQVDGPHTELAARWKDPIDGFGREPTRVRLSAVPIERADEWLAARYPSRGFSSSVARRIWEATSGSPRGMDALVHQLAPDDTDDPDVSLLGLERRLEDALLARAAEVNHTSQRLLALLSLAGPGAIAVDELEAASSRLEPVSTRRVLESLDALQERGIVEVRDETLGPTAAWTHDFARRRYRDGLGDDERERALEALSPTGDGPIETSSEATSRSIARSRRVSTRLLATGAVSAAATRLESALASSETGVCGGLTPQERRSLLRDLAELHFAAGDLERAVDRGNAWTALDDPSEDEVDCAAWRTWLSELHHARGDLSTAERLQERSIEVLERESAARPTPEARRALASALISHARILLERERLDEAAARLEACDRVLAADGDTAADVELRARSLLIGAELHRERNEHARAAAASRRAFELAKSTSDLDLLVQATVALGLDTQGRESRGPLIEAYGTAIERAKRRSRRRELARLSIGLGTAHHDLGEHEPALACYRRALRLSAEIDDREGVAIAWNNLGNVHRLRDRSDLATESYRKAIDAFSRLGDSRRMAASMRNLASVLEEEGRYGDALEYAHRALEDPTSSRARTGLAFSLYRVGRIYQAKGELAKARKHAERALHLREELDHRLGIGYSRLQLAEIALGLGHLFEAFQSCQQAREEFERLGNPIGSLLGRELLARVLAKLGDLDESERLASEVLNEARRSEQRAVEGDALLDLAAIAIERSRPQVAKKRLKEAERIFRDVKNRRRVVQALLDFGAASIDLGDREGAEGVLEEAYSLLEELGIRDLVAWFFLLRARVESLREDASPASVHKLLQRGMVEARETGLRDLEWRLQRELGLLAIRSGDRRLAAVHAASAQKTLQEMCRELPERFQSTFFDLRERRALRDADGEPAPTQELDPRTCETPDEMSNAAAVDALRSASTPGQEGDDDRSTLASLNREFLELYKIITARDDGGSVDELLERIVDSVIGLVRAERGFLIVRAEEPHGDASGDTITVARNFDREEIASPEGKLSRTVARRVQETGEPFRAGDALAHEDLSSVRSVKELRLRSILCVPLRVGEQVLGALYVDNRHRRHAFDEQDLRVARAFCDQAAMAITTARRLDERARSHRRLRGEVRRTSAELAAARADLERTQQEGARADYRIDTIVGRSPAMREVLDLIATLSHATTNVLVAGESGTGKELVARCLHFAGDRRDGPFVSESCGALSDTLLDSELFGHTSGAFTGATTRRQGLFERADGGTLFLDEVGELSEDAQKKLLRVLQEGEIRPLGSSGAKRVDVRIVASTGSDLRALVDAGEFREDLFWRLHGVTIQLPPLRERREDIPDLLEHFSKRTAAKLGRRAPTFSNEAVQAVVDHDWPGNVRELRHFVERTLLVARVDPIAAEDLVFDATPQRRHARVSMHVDGSLLSFREARDAFESEYVRAALEEAEGNVALASRLSGMSRESFYRLLKKHEIRRG